MKLISETNFGGTSNGKKGIGTLLLAVSIVGALIGGTVLGIGITRIGNSEDRTSAVSESEFQRLKSRVGFLENRSMNEPTTISV